MNSSEIMRVAHELRLAHGARAKREATHKLLLSVAENDSAETAFWRSVIDNLIEEERQNPRIYDRLIDRESGPGDMLVGELRQAAAQVMPPSASEWRNLSNTCGKAATYIGALERALRSLLTDGDEARPAATAVLVEGPPEE